jgi:hypothetical protein
MNILLRNNNQINIIECTYYYDLESYIIIKIEINNLVFFNFSKREREKVLEIYEI